MKLSKLFVTGILSAALVFALVLTGCPTSDDDSNSGPPALPPTSGKLTITNAASIDGKYVIAVGGDGEVMGVASGSEEAVVGKQVAGGTVEIPLYLGTDNGVEEYNKTESISVVLLWNDGTPLAMSEDMDGFPEGFSGKMFTSPVSFAAGVGTLDFTAAGMQF
jgi:hypothetical protein